MNCELPIKKSSNRGYTIIETMIAVSLFVIIVMIGMGALLNANVLHQKSRDMRSITDNLNFIMEDMSRNLRTGYDYHCIDGGGPADANIPYSCPSGGVGMYFRAASLSQWMYYVGATDDGYGIFKAVDGIAVQLTPDEVMINAAASFFTVTGAEPPPGNSEQPFVTVRLVGDITFKNVVTPFSLQTSVSQRLIDL